LRVAAGGGEPCYGWRRTATTVQLGRSENTLNAGEANWLGVKVTVPACWNGIHTHARPCFLSTNTVIGPCGVCAAARANACGLFTRERRFSAASLETQSEVLAAAEASTAM